LQNTIAKRAFARRLLSCDFFSHKHRTLRENGMEKLLNSLPGTVIAGFVLVIVMMLVIHAIH